MRHAPVVVTSALVFVLSALGLAIARPAFVREPDPRDMRYTRFSLTRTFVMAVIAAVAVVVLAM